VPHLVAVRLQHLTRARRGGPRSRQGGCTLLSGVHPNTLVFGMMPAVYTHDMHRPHSWGLCNASGEQAKDSHGGARCRAAGLRRGRVCEAAQGRRHLRGLRRQLVHAGVVVHEQRLPEVRRVVVRAPRHLRARAPRALRVRSGWVQARLGLRASPTVSQCPPGKTYIRLCCRPREACVRGARASSACPARPARRISEQTEQTLSDRPPTPVSMPRATGQPPHPTLVPPAPAAPAPGAPPGGAPGS